MTDALKKHQGWILPLVFNLIIGGLIYTHSMSVKAAIVEELKDYVPKGELMIREKAHSDWAAEATKRIEGKIDDLKVQVNRLESRPRPAFDRP